MPRDRRFYAEQGQKSPSTEMDGFREAGVILPMDRLLTFLQSNREGSPKNIVFEGIPEDAQYTRCHYDAERDSLIVFFHSKEAEPVQPGQRCPLYELKVTVDTPRSALKSSKVEEPEEAEPVGYAELGSFDDVKQGEDFINFNATETPNAGHARPLGSNAGFRPEERADLPNAGQPMLTPQGAGGMTIPKKQDEDGELSGDQKAQAGEVARQEAKGNIPPQGAPKIAGEKAGDKSTAEVVGQPKQASAMDSPDLMKSNADPRNTKTDAQALDDLNSSVKQSGKVAEDVSGEHEGHKSKKKAN